MALNIFQTPVTSGDNENYRVWLDIPTTIISDELNRFSAMDAGIRPYSTKVSFAGPALPVRVIAADNAALHYAVAEAKAGAVIVVDAGGFLGSAVWGGILQLAAQARGVSGVVIDGAIRDSADLRVADAPVFARGCTPAGPHKGWGGDINIAIQCGGCPVEPGDLVRGDEDGIVVVPERSLNGLLTACRKRIELEAKIEREIFEGASSVDLVNLPSAKDF